MARKKDPNRGRYAPVEDVKPGWLVSIYPHTAAVVRTEDRGRAVRLYFDDGRMASRPKGHPIRIYARARLKKTKRRKAKK